MTAKRAVVQQDNSVCIDLGGDCALPVRLGNSPATFGPGWSPLFAYLHFTPFIFLELQHDNGQRATWILDQNGMRIAGLVSELSEDNRSALLASVRPVIFALVTGIFSEPPYSDAGGAREFFSLSHAIRSELLRLCGTPDLPTPQALGVEMCGDIVVPARMGEAVTLPHAAIRDCLATSLEERYLTACRTGMMTWPSPVDGGEVTEVRGLVISHLLIAWRCVDRRNGLLFFVLAAGFGNPVGALYIPAANCLIWQPRTCHTQIDIAGIPYVQAIADHALQYGESLLDFVASPVRRFAQFTWPPPAAHIGHYLWNELSGLERIVQNLEPVHYPLVYDLGGAAGADFYGAVPLLFPELKGRIIRNRTNYTDMLVHAYAHNVQVFRFSGSYVSAEQRKRITNVVAMMPAAEDARIATWDTKGPVVVFGLRVENRTLVDLAGFYIGVATRLAARFGRLTIIVDGHNSKSQANKDTTFASYLEDRASRRPVDVEHQVVAAIRDGLAAQPVTVVDCVGMTILDNLAWMSVANYCVAPWGAGFAKYRWVLNLPTYVTISNYCKLHKNDIDIYHNSEFMEAPTRQIFVNEAFVVDRPESPTVVRMDSAHVPYYVNYDVDIEQAASEIGDALAEIGGPTATWSRRRPHGSLRIEGERAEVVIGLDDELFLAKGGHYILDHVLGYMTPLKTSFANFSTNIAGRAKLAANIGAKYAHIIFPDKQSVLQSSFGVPDLICLGDLYGRACADVGDRVIYPQVVLREASGKIFLKTDTHMTHLGTLAVAEVLLRKFFGAACDDWVAGMRSRPTHTRQVSGDLGSKVQPQRYEDKNALNFDSSINYFSNKLSNGNNGSVTIYCHASAPRPERVMIFGDSFCGDLAWILADLFQEVAYLRTPYVHPDLIEMGRPDILISGNVERYFHYVESDNNRPNFTVMNTMEYGESDVQRDFAGVFSAVSGFGRPPYGCMMDKLFYGAA